MFEDPIVEEIHRIRREHAAKFNNDMTAIADDIRRMERESGRTYVSFPAKRITLDSIEAKTGRAFRERQTA
jgi:hypothetical protein